jgi:hypothetical protein
MMSSPEPPDVSTVVWESVRLARRARYPQSIA